MRWIKIHDSLLKWEWADNPNMMSLWLHLLLSANYEDRQWHGRIIKRGELVTSLASLSERTGISVRGVRTCLDRLKTTNEIEEETTNKYRIITICKFDDYQLNENESDKQTTNKVTNKRQTNDKQTTTPVERENIRTLSGEKENLKEKERSFVEPEFKESFNMWLEYKRQRRESYKSELSLKKCYNNLVKLSEHNPTVAMAIVEQSMANNWAGLFALKQEYTKNGNYREQERLERAKRVVETIARLDKEDTERGTDVRGQKVVPF